ncbi:MAG: hypothetical protein HYY76_04785 [Acidobacteria bacterium]|nr:hypothetical protein [Acidobacteriota bacterium]
MNVHLFRLVASGALMLAASPGLAHHYFPRESDTPTTVTGTVVRFDMVNPHARLLLEVRDSSGTATIWDIELGSIQVLVARGWKRDAVRAGDVVTADVIMWKGRANAGSARTVQLPDGRKVFAGSHAGDSARR